MDTIAKESGITQRTLELCQAVVEQPDFQALAQKLDAFLGDEMLKFRYQQVNELRNLLQMKQNHGLELTPEEITQFDTLRDEFVGNPVAKGFLEAQQQVAQLHEVVGRFLDKTFELGRRPEYDDVHDGSCSGCGTH